MTIFKKMSVFALLLCAMGAGAWHLTQPIRAISYYITPTDTAGRAEVILRVARPFDPDEQVGFAQPTAGQLAAGTGFHDHGCFA